MNSRYLSGRGGGGKRYRKRDGGCFKPPAPGILEKMPWTRIAVLSEVPPGEVIEAIHQGEPYAVCNVNGEVRVISGVCPHAGGPLGQGTLDGGILTCPFHAWEFDCATGVCTMD